jgi:hypothetical protein
MKELHAKGKLNATQSLFMADRKPELELYDIEKDPHEVNNLAASAAHRNTVMDMDRRLQAWLKQMDDKGAVPEPESARSL